MKEKVVWIVNEYNGANRECTRQTVLSRKLEEKGYTVYIICGSSKVKDSDNLLSSGERIKYINGDEAKGYIIKTSDFHNGIERIIIAIQFQRRLWKLRKQLPNPDVIVSNFAGIFGYVFLKWKHKFGTRVIYDILDLWPEAFVQMGLLKKGSIVAKYLYNLEHKTYREADGLIFSMQGGRDYIVEKGWSSETGGDVDTTDIGYLNNGVDLETVDRQKETKILYDSDLDSDKFKVVYLGSISFLNGLGILVDTANVLQGRGESDILFLVYGYGNDLEHLKKCVEEKKLSNIKFKGKLDKQFAMNMLSRGDLNVFTFRDSPLWQYGVSPNKLFMYFASGKPVLSMIKPKYDLVIQHEAGLSVDNNPEIVADAIIRFKNMPKEEYKKYCKNARATAEAYDYNNLVDVLVDKIEGRSVI